MRAVLILGIALSLIGLAGAVEPLHLVPRNSYLIRPIANASDLANQIRSEPIVAQRYARHFRRNAWEFADYVEKHLRLTRLERAQTFNVYYSPPDDRILVVRRTLPKGTHVFVDKRTNKPILKANCGNPLTPAASVQPTPQVEKPIDAATTPVVAAPLMVESPSEAQPPLIELVEVPDAPIEEVVAADVLPTETLVETIPEAAPEAEPITPPTIVAETPALPPAIVSRGPSWIPFLPLIAAFAPRGGGDVAPIPEPTSALVLGAGLGLLYPLSRRALRRSRNSSQRTGDSNTHSA
ncbi:MAG: hypothetical protein KatS3mg017_0570 [Fimbriimonadales bacterium]|nr:MAG: hypothetical protein KatS3mg017_0570 [Fimbriimonadales bacterium]